ncbi:MAG: carboxypeptidase-like regulatory domain-containing protein, partial [Tannerella sp.]|nr:carboxypeptidase-like regulatory domain-containing protein [Tannerella sp.]
MNVICYKQKKEAFYERTVERSWRMLFVCLLLSASCTVTAQISVSGTVTEAGGDPLPGVNITVKGVPTGVMTDIDGKYAISVPAEKSVLIFSYIGYTAREIAVGSKRQIDVILLESATELD